MPYFKTNDGCSIYHETHDVKPSKPVVAFLNGTMQDTLYWRAQATAVKDNFGFLLYDARAQGKSGLGRKRLSLECHVSDLISLLDYLKIEKAYLVGMSHGARVALAYAADFPDRVKGLFLCGIGVNSNRRSSLIIKSWLEILKNSGLEAMVWSVLPVAFGKKFLKSKQRILPGIVKSIVNRNNKQSLIAYLEAMDSYPVLPEVVAGGFNMPCLVVSGSDDPFVTKEEAMHLADLYGGKHKYIAGAGHSVPAEAPELFTMSLLEFLLKGQ